MDESTEESKAQSSNSKDEKNVNKDTNEKRNVYFRALSEKTSKLPGWLDHFNSKDLKVLFKCCAAVWIYTLFIFINPTLRAFGQATFFGAIVLFMAPPSGVIFIVLLASSTLLIGVCLAWAWGTITMKAALAARPAADLQARYVELQRMATQQTTNVQQASGQTSFTQVAVFNGFFLDVRVSATYFCMMGLFIYLVARLRVKAPKLTLLAIFSIIICDIYLTIAPLIPTFSGTIPRTLIIPAGVATGVSFVSSIIFFPRSTSHIVLDNMQTILQPMNEFLQACMIDFRDPATPFNLDQLKKSRKAFIATWRALQGNVAFLPLDASMGRFSSSDIKEIAKPLRQVMVAFLGIMHMQISRQEHKIKDRRILKLAGLMAADSGKRSSESDLLAIEDSSKDQVEAHTADSTADVAEPDLTSLAKACADLLPICEEAVSSVVESLHNCNTRRWVKRPSKEECDSRHKAHTTVLTSLRTHISEFKGRTAHHLWEDYSHHFDEKGHLVDNSSKTKVSPLTELMLSLIFEEKIEEFAVALEALLATIVSLEDRRATTRVWLPGGLQNLFTWAFHDDSDPAKEMALSDSSSEQTLVEDSKSEPGESEKTEKKKKKKHAKKVKEAVAQLTKSQSHGGRKRSKGGQIVLGTYQWFTNTEGLYALRVLVATIGLGVVAVIPTSAGFFYREKGLWALIMAQTGMLPYTADFIFALITRLIGTVAGAVIGLVAWYIGAGSGPGNPYGMAAIMVPVIVVLMWLRLFTSPAALQGIVITAATSYLVVGYSWSDSHIPSYGNPGVGYSVFWRRMLLVMIGFGVATFVTLFPRPPSANRHYRHLLSEALGTVQNQYGLLTINHTQGEIEDLEEVVEKTGISVGGALLEIEPTIALTKLEFSSSNYDATTLQKVCQLCLNLNHAATLLLLYLPKLPSKLQKRFQRVTSAFEDQTLANIMTVLSLARQTLQTGDALPVVYPLLLSFARHRTRSAKQQHLSHPVAEQDKIDGGERGHQDGARTPDHDADTDLVFSKALLAEVGIRKYCSTMAAYISFLESIDELIFVMKEAVGENGNVKLSTVDV